MCMYDRRSNAPPVLTDAFMSAPSAHTNQMAGWRRRVDGTGLLDSWYFDLLLKERDGKGVPMLYGA